MRRAGAALVLIVVLAGCGTRGTSSAAHGPVNTSGSTGTGPVSSARVSVAPITGGRSAVFTVRFIAPQSAGAAGQLRIGYTVSVTGGQGSGCLGAGSVQSGTVTAGVAATAALDPARLGSRWCPGTHVVRVIETGAPVCKAGTMCPQFLRVIGVVGAARFTVTR